MVVSRKRSTVANCFDVASTAGSTVAVMCRPFDHQVGGHIPLSRADPFHLCKPVDEREVRFYQEMPEALTTVVPAFCGFTEGPSSPLIPSPHSSCSLCSSGHPLPPLPSPYLSISEERRETLTAKRKLDRLQYQTIVLQDLTSSFHHPSIVDLKMGTRQYGDSASEEKRRSMTEKCANSTSQQWGVRMCGLQYYNADTDSVNHVDKYKGRAFCMSTLSNSLASFLAYPNGKPRMALCHVLLRRIDEIEEAICSVDGLRLYGASLLIVYEGASIEEPQNMEEAEKLITVRVVDFANATFPGFLDGLPYSGPDNGFVLGLHTIRDLVTAFMGMMSTECETDSDGSLSP